MKIKHLKIKAAGEVAFMRYSAGYTLVELIVVISIIAILAGTITVSMTESYSDAQIVNAISMALADVRYAQEMAVTRRRSVDIRVTQGSNMYEAYWTGTSDYLTSPATGEDLVVTFGTGQYSNITMTSSELGGVLRFDFEGRPTINGSNFGDDTEILSLNDKYQIIVEPSGLTYFYDPYGGWGCGCGG